jgi:putative transcriptional regulator
VALICQHDSEGAMGVVVNRASEYTLGEVFQQMGIRSDDAELCANRCSPAAGASERGFVLHDGEREWDSSLPIGDSFTSRHRATSSKPWRVAMGPRHVTVALGCAGWGAGQLESELVENSWITAPADPRVLFGLPLGARWEAAAGSIGVDMSRMADYSGHA